MHSNLFNPSLTQFGWYLAVSAGCGLVLRDDGASHDRLLEIREHATDGLAYIKNCCMTWLPHGRGLRDEFQIAERRINPIHPPLPHPEVYCNIWLPMTPRAWLTPALLSLPTPHY